jgi:hypothetical protein
VTTANNSVTGFDVNGNPVPVTGYNAGPGWDPVTGMGPPDVRVLAPLAGGLGVTALAATSAPVIRRAGTDGAGTAGAPA